MLTAVFQNVYARCGVYGHIRICGSWHVLQCAYAKFPKVDQNIEEVPN